MMCHTSQGSVCGDLVLSSNSLLYSVSRAISDPNCFVDRLAIQEFVSSGLSCDGALSTTGNHNRMKAINFPREQVVEI